MLKRVKGWFTTDGRPGDRTLKDQLKGLDWLLANCKGKSILDVGCAEGLISIELVRRGAAAAHGVEIVPAHVAVGNQFRGELPVMFEVGDLNTWRPKRQYDIVIALALLHKTRNPTAVCAALAACAREAVVLRLPPAHAPTIIDERSNYERHYIGSVMARANFMLAEENYDGHFGEWVGVYVWGPLL